MSKRFARVYRAAALALAAMALVACGTASAGRHARPGAAPTDDQIFVRLRQAALGNDAARAAQLAAMIPNYPAPSYLEYFQLRPQLFDGSGHARLDAPDEPVLSFLQRHDGEAIADRLRNDYLLVLGARHDWRNFDAQYPRFVLNDDTQVPRTARTSRKRRARCSSSRSTTATAASI
jgi:soluble lytic murein transglycosylase